MNRHPYLRAYMAGIAVPTMFMLVVLTFFCVARFRYHVAFPIERLMLFPVTLVPNAWGLWNMLYVRLHARLQVPIGVYGALFLVPWIPIAYFIQQVTDLMIWTPTLVAIAFPVAIVLYYLAWKHLVGFFNELLGIA